MEYVGLPNPLSPRIFVPRSSPRAAAAGLHVTQASAPGRQAAFLLLRACARSGLFHLAPRTQEPIRSEEEVLAPFIPPGGHIAVARSRWSSGAFVALILDAGAVPVAVAKYAKEASDRRKLHKEAAATVELGGRLTHPVAAPRLLAEREGILLWEAVRWRTRFPSWRPPQVVLHRLGELFSGGSDAPWAGPAHGDFAPWNLLRTRGAWILVDWADARCVAPPFFDAFHYLVQSHIFLGHPSVRALFAGLRTGRGWVGDAIEAYARGASIDEETAARHFAEYLRLSGAGMSRRATRGRERLLHAWEREEK